MNKFVIFYTMHREYDYAKLWLALQNMGAVHADGSIWFLSTSLDSVTVRDRLYTTMKKGDTLCVTHLAVGGLWAGAYMKPEAVKWLQTHIHP